MNPLTPKKPQPLSKLTAEQRRMYDTLVAEPGLRIGDLAERLGCDVHRCYIHLPKLQQLGRVERRERRWYAL